MGSVAVAAVKAPRSLALDALRGLAIVGMIFSGTIPHGLPRWMSHAQVSIASNYKYDASISGITWVDLVFPFFIFALGAAVPFAMRSRLEKGWPVWKAVLSLVKRWLLLVAFAVFQGQTGPWGFSTTLPVIVTPADWASYGFLYTFYNGGTLTLLAFTAMFLALWRTPDSWKPKTKWGISAAGWAIGLGMFYLVPMKGDASMSVEKNNIILWMLANLAMFTGLAWLLARESFTARFWMMGTIVAVGLANYKFSFIKSIPIWPACEVLGWESHRLGALLSPTLIAYLGVALPGTMAGDILQQWMRGKVREAAPDAPSAWSRWRMWRIVAVGVLMSVFTCGYTLTREVYTGWIICTVLGAAGWWLTSTATSAAEHTVRKLFLFGAALLFIGYIVEPHGGGVKKDPSTLSYFYMTAGLAFYMLGALVLMIDVMGCKRPFGLVIGSGQNPMIAYVGGTFFWTPVLGMLGVSALIQTHIIDAQILGCSKIVWSTVWAVITTLLVMILATMCSRAKIFWRT